MVIPFGLLRPQVTERGFVQYGLYDKDTFDDLVYNQNYIPIASADELNALRNLINQPMGVGTPYFSSYFTGLDKKYVVYKPIDLSSYSNWSPIGAFTGEFFGNEVGVSNLTISGAADQVGLFSVAGTGCIIKDCVILAPSINVIGSKVGALCGNITNGTYTNNKVLLGTITANDQAGGLYGYSSPSVSQIISDSYSTANVSLNTSTGRGGGFIGWLFSGTPTITDCYATGTVTGSSVGGFCSQIRTSAIITNCYSTGNVPATNYAGGFAVNIEGASQINECYASGNVTGSIQSAGFAINLFGVTTITDCYATGSATGTGKNAGFVSEIGVVLPATNVNVINCYSIGAVNSGSTNDGFINTVAGTYTVTSCYWDTATSGQATSAAGTGKTTTEMQQGSIPDTAIYVGWSNLIWDALDNSSYPELINLQ